jgi:hypothetical protein
MLGGPPSLPAGEPGVTPAPAVALPGGPYAGPAPGSPQPAPGSPAAAGLAPGEQIPPPNIPVNQETGKPYRVFLHPGDGDRAMPKGDLYVVIEDGEPIAYRSKGATRR